MGMSQYINVSLSLIALTGLVGAGVAVGSGVGMMTLAMAKQEEEAAAALKVVAHSPVERKGSLTKSFAASGVQN